MDRGRTRPRLGVISDVSPEDSVSGQKLVYRLLVSWDPAAVLVYEGNVWPSDASRRLPGVDYRTLKYAPARLFHTRVTGFVNALCLHTIRWPIGRLAREMERFGAEAILTVAHGHLFLAAAAVARRMGLPLHVLLHDDWISTMPGGSWPWSSLASRFRRIYEDATSRMCASPYMEEEYRRQMGVAGSVLLPTRENGSPPGSARPPRRREGPWVVAYAGSLPSPDYVKRLKMVASSLAEVPGRLDLYTNSSADTLNRLGLGATNIRAVGFLPAQELRRQVQESADALFLPMSFAESDRMTMSVCFPSKLVEYTAIGLPIVVWGPDYSAAVRWMRDHGAGELAITEPSPDAFRATLDRIRNDPGLAERMTACLVEAGNRMFDFDRGQAAFGTILGADAR